MHLINYVLIIEDLVIIYLYISTFRVKRLDSVGLILHAGSIVANASLFGYAKGTARGMAPQARIASYKVCWNETCAGSDILAAFDRAIMDGVDVLSVSLSNNATTYYNDVIALGAFAAIEKGIIVSRSPGNDGPRISTVVSSMDHYCRCCNS